MATKTKEDFKKENFKLGTIKAAYSRAHKYLGQHYEALEALINRRGENSSDWSEATAKMTSEAIQRYRMQAEQALDNLDRGGEALIAVIFELGPDDTNEGVEGMTKKVSDDIVDCNDRYAELNSKYARALEEANELNYPAKKQKNPSRPREPAETPEYASFQSYPEMKPNFLNQHSDMVDINEFCRLHDYGVQRETTNIRHLNAFVPVDALIMNTSSTGQETGRERPR